MIEQTKSIENNPTEAAEERDAAVSALEEVLAAARSYRALPVSVNASDVDVEEDGEIWASGKIGSLDVVVSGTIETGLDAIYAANLPASEGPIRGLDRNMWDFVSQVLANAHAQWEELERRAQRQCEDQQGRDRGEP